MPQLVKPWLRTEKRNKYGAKKVVFEGITFDSQMEVRYLQDVRKARGVGGGINADRDLVAHPEKVVLIRDSKGKVIVDWKADFYDPVRGCYIDVKGAETQRFRLLKKLLKAFCPLPVMVVTELPGLRFPWKEMLIKEKVRD